MNRVLTRSERRKIDTLNRLVRASYKVFSRKGFFRATLDDITEEADVGKGTIYYHFKNKLHLASYLTKKSVNDLLNYCKKKTSGIEDPQELITELVNAHFAFFAKKRPLFNVLFFVRGVLHQDLENRYLGAIQNQYQGYISFLADTLDQGIKKGVFRPFNPINQAYVLHGIIIGFISQWTINERKGSFGDKAHLVSETFLQGIVGPQRKKTRRERTMNRQSYKKSPDRG